MRALTIVPAKGDFADHRGIRAVIRPERDKDDDDCDCEDEGSSAQSCDPEGYSIDSFDQLRHQDGFSLIPGFASGNEDDGGDGCDECDSKSAWSLERFREDLQFEALAKRMSASPHGPDWRRHFEQLSLAAESGDAVLILSCDPD